MCNKAVVIFCTYTSLDTSRVEEITFTTLSPVYQLPSSPCHPVSYSSTRSLSLGIYPSIIVFATRGWKAFHLFLFFFFSSSSEIILLRTYKKGTVFLAYFQWFPCIKEAYKHAHTRHNTYTHCGSVYL